MRGIQFRVVASLIVVAALTVACGGGVQVPNLPDPTKVAQADFNGLIAEGVLVLGGLNNTLKQALIMETDAVRGTGANDAAVRSAFAAVARKNNATLEDLRACLHAANAAAGTTTAPASPCKYANWADIKGVVDPIITDVNALVSVGTNSPSAWAKFIEGALQIVIAFAQSNGSLGAFGG